VFDEAGQAIADTNALNNRTTSVYDVAGKVSATINSLGARITNIYDVAGQTVATVRAVESARRAQDPFLSSLFIFGKIKV